MKKLLVLLMVLGVQLSGSHVVAQKIKGSDTLLPLSQLAAERYLKKYPDQAVVVTGGGSGVGISALLEGTTDIAQSSRKISFGEKQKLQNNGKNVQEVVAAYDVLAVVVHPDNPVSGLTREQLEKIFTGKIKNWSEVGGRMLKIVPYSRETSSGTYEFFKEQVLKNKNYMSGIMSLPATGAIIQSISQTKGAIGYVGWAYAGKSVKAISVSYDEGKTFVKPSPENVENKTYPIVRPLLYYYIPQDNDRVKPFIDYVLSDEGQLIVQECGFIPVKYK
jgi:phosphate transport system substrate-binding protein